MTANASRAAALLGSLGGSAKSDRKTAANRAKMKAHWKLVKAGKREHKPRGKATKKKTIC